MKTILKEIDPLAFDEALKMNSSQKKQYAVKQDEDDRKALDKKWEAVSYTHLTLPTIYSV